MRVKQALGNYKDLQGMPVVQYGINSFKNWSKYIKIEYLLVSQLENNSLNKQI